MLILVFCLPAGAQNSKATAQQTSTQNQASQKVSSDQDDTADLKADLAKMKALLNQMQAVFALTGSTTSPVNHELELNIDMWSIIIDRMDRHLQRMERAKGGKTN
jgi:hypothetical protein